MSPAIIVKRRKESALVYGYQFVNKRFFCFSDNRSGNQAAYVAFNGILLENFSANLRKYVIRFLS